MSRFFSIFKRIYYFLHFTPKKFFLNFEENSGEEIRNNFSKLSITYIGQATCLIQIDGINILTDPHWGKHVTAIFKKRYSNPSISIKNLPPIDLILLSHAHYDHLHKSTLQKISTKNTTIITEKTILPILKKIPGIHIGGDWENFIVYKTLKIHFIQVKHWGSRYILDRKRKFTGFIIEGSKNSVFFPGDTAYFDGLKEIGGKFKLDIALMPIGDYKPRSIKKEIHISPEEVIKATKELKVKKCIPYHWGTFRMSKDHSLMPVEELIKYAKDEQIENKIYILKHGETYWE